MSVVVNTFFGIVNTILNALMIFIKKNFFTKKAIMMSTTRRTILSTSTIPTTATSTLVSSMVMPSSSIYDRISPQPLSYSSVLRSHTPITPGGDYSDSQSEASGDKGKRRKLPSVPFDEEPVSPILATRKLIKDRLAGKL